MDFKSGHRRLRPAKKPSVLGGGLLERARSTTLALLGVTTAVGLTMVALALNQSWPLVADSPIPVIPPRQEAVGDASVAARAIASVDAPDPGPAGAESSRGADSARPAGGGSGGDVVGPRIDPAPSASAELVVAPSAPAEPRGDAPPGGGEAAPAPSPTATSPGAPASPVPVSATPDPEPTPSPPPAVETPPPTSAEAPVDSSDEDEWDEDDDWDDDDDSGWGGGHGQGRGHHWSRGHRDD